MKVAYKKAKRLLLIGGNFSPEPTGIGKYNGEMMEWLSQNGYSCTVITTAPYYPHWKVRETYTNKWFSKEIVKGKGEPITILRCPHYIPHDPGGKKRILSDISFSISAFIRVLGLLTTKKFDFVLAVVPPFHIGIHAWLYKKLRGAKFLYHIQDLQIEAARDLGMVKSKALLRAMFSVEKFIMDRADVVSTISEGMIKKVQQKTKTPVQFLPNWVDTNLFFPIKDTGPLKVKYGFQATDFIILYSGAIGEKQGLEIIIEAAGQLQENKSIQFIICGEGPYKNKLQLIVAEIQLKNIHFLPLQPFEFFNEFLNMASLHLIIQKKNAGDLVMPSKLTTILAVGGLALVTADIGSSLYNVIHHNKIGLVAAPENSVALSLAIEAEISEGSSTLKENARKYAVSYLSIDNILKGYMQQHLS